MVRKHPKYEEVRQNLIYLNAIVRDIVDNGDLDLALTCTKENIATAKAILKLSQQQP